MSITMWWNNIVTQIKLTFIPKKMFRQLFQHILASEFENFLPFAAFTSQYDLFYFHTKTFIMILMLKNSGANSCISYLEKQSVLLKIIFGKPCANLLFTFFYLLNAEIVIIITCWFSAQRYLHVILLCKIL